MRERLSSSIIMVAIAGAAVSAVISTFIAHAPAQAQLSPAPSLTTPWGDPDLQGIWTDQTDTPLQRPARFADQEFFTDAQRAELDQQRSAMRGRDNALSAGLWLTSPAPTMMYSHPRSEPVRGRRGSSIRPMAGSHR